MRVLDLVEESDASFDFDENYKENIASNAWKNASHTDAFEESTSTNNGEESDSRILYPPEDNAGLYPQNFENRFVEDPLNGTDARMNSNENPSFVTQTLTSSLELTGSSGLTSTDISVTPDEIVQDFSQCGIGDCWYLASIKSLSISSLGQQLFGNVINVGTSTATVTFQGTLDYTYEVSLAGLVTEVNDGDEYSTPAGHSKGDADVVLLEMALKEYTISIHTNFGSPYTGGSMDQALSLITGKACGYYSNSSGDVTVAAAKLNELAQVIDHTAITASCNSEANPSLDIPAYNHAYSIVGIDTTNQTVSFRNPWYSGTVLKEISYADFAYYFRSIAYVDLTSNNKCLYAIDGGGTLDGGTGNDKLYGGQGANTLNGNAGDDLLYGDGNVDHLYGGAGVDTLIGWGGDDILAGGAGADCLYGKTGNDSYFVDDVGDIVVENENEGVDTVFSNISRAIYNNNIENLFLTGGLDINGFGNDSNNRLTGNAGNNWLYGRNGNDVLIGAAGDDFLYGEAGNDTLIGGLGNDTYFIDETGDIASEAANEGIDTVYSSVTYRLGLNFENLVLSGTSAINGYGNVSNNSLTGNGAANILNGLAGNDTMYGGYGNDIYYVDSADDIVVETSWYSTEIDTVISSANFSLGSNIERLTLSGTAAINGAGNELNNILTGNAANNVLNGGFGVDTMVGGLGNDVYYIDNARDIAYEASSLSTEIDTVISSANFSLGSNIERLTLSGTAAINGAGNGLNNILIGNAANNILNGGVGADTMIGGLGNDTYYVENTGDKAVEASAVITEIDTVFSSATFTLGANVERLLLFGSAAINGTGNALANTLTGNAAANILKGEGGNDILNGGLGNDTLVGGAGKDSFLFNTTLNRITNTDTISDFSVIDDTFCLENAIFTQLTTMGRLAADFFKSNGTGTALDANDYILYNTSSGALFYDADGSGTVSTAIQFATFSSKPVGLSYNDFITV